MADIVVDDAAVVVDGEVTPEPGNEALPKPAGRTRRRSRGPSVKKTAAPKAPRAPRARKKASSRLPAYVLVRRAGTEVPAYVLQRRN